MSKQTDFIQKIAPLVQKIAPRYGIACCSAVIAQACLESAYGTSGKAQHHNYFGLKYRLGRLTCNSGIFVDGSSEQRSDGSRYDITDSWYEFSNMEDGVEGYFQFINISNYANVKGVADPETYLNRIRADGYATSLDYVKNVMAVVTAYGLTKYDKAQEPKGGQATGKADIRINQNTGFKGFNVTVGREKPSFIVMHYVGAAGSAANNVAYFNGGNRSASADFFVDENGIWQYNPDIDRQYSWHCGGGRQSSQGGSFYGTCRNANSIGIEMCCYQVGNLWAFREKTVDNAVELVRYLMGKYGIPASHVIRHFDVTGKYCPNVPGWIPPTGSEVKWSVFKNRLSAADGQIVEVLTDPDASAGENSPWTGAQYPPIRRGSTGSAVEALQKKLNLHGAGLIVDGDFGSKTEEALKAFQTQNGLVADGICGPLTWVKVNVIRNKGGQDRTQKWVGRVTATILNVRKGAGTNFPYLAEYPQLARGNLIDVCDIVKADDGSTWYYIRIAGKWYGFVHSAYIVRA